jgi:hypothetical protein
MGILYGGMIAYLIPIIARWWPMEAGLVPRPADVPPPLRWAVTLMGVGVLLSGIRDLYAALGGPGGGWPWTVPQAIER